LSKLIEKLERISEGRAQPLGFGAAASRTRSLPMLVIASVPAGSAKPDEVVAKTGADAVLLTIENWKKEREALAKISSGKADFIWGVYAQAVSGDEVEQLVEMKCDFVVFAAEMTPAAVLNEERIGKVLQIDSSLDDNLTRAVGRLAVDAVLLSPPGKDQPPLTISQLMVYERLAAGAGKHLLAALPPVSPTDDLETWWSLGVRGVVVDMTADHAGDKLAQVKEAIEKLPTTKKKGTKASAVLPQIAREPAAARPEEDDDDDDEDY
jgi:hypothetical protein